MILPSQFPPPPNPNHNVRLDDIQTPIADDLEQFERTFRDSMRTRVALLDRIMYYIVQRKGKQMRPMFVFFAARLCGNINQATYRSAALVELLHTATLIHDDVVDDAYQRRGFFSVNALWKNKIAVLVGDYVLSRGLLLAIDNGDFRALQLLSRAVREMSEGELLQIERSKRLNLDENVYYDIIRQKTATLIAAACTVGFASTCNDPELEKKVWEMGEKIGIAFQIKDDLFDLGGSNYQTGKAEGVDIKEKKLTLPIIYALQQATENDRQQIIYTIKNDHDKPRKVAEVIKFVQQSGGIEYADNAMQRFRQEALDILAQFPKGVGRQGLEQLIWFTTERKK